MIEILLLLVLFITVGLLIEKVLHLDYDIAGVTFALKQDISKLIKAAFSKPVVRHKFDITLPSEIKSVTKPYVKKGFEVQIANNLFRNVPVVAVRFVPDHVLEEAELLELIQSLLTKLREYMEYYGLTWKTFANYYVGSDYVMIFIYYAELECDLLPFTNVYRKTVRQKTDKSGGTLRDEELEAELRHVN